MTAVTGQLCDGDIGRSSALPERKLVMELCTVAFADIASLTCRNCARTTEFEQPPCPDGHGSDCPEWYCTECGAATFVGWSA
ncbi:MAG: hypothetical protein M3400_07060, partial [Actinomycetota bacterium]|nr:hypothetical protein [Actinomycetota bacterium]